MMKTRLLRAALSVAAVTGLAAALAAAPAYSADPVEGGAFYVDCGGASNGNGQIDSPLNNVTAVNDIQFEPGDQLYFKRGETCVGELAPQGSGTAEAPIVIAAYGEAPQRAKIDADGATNALLLKNNAYIHVQDLELVAPGDNSQVRRGVYLVGDNGGELDGVVLEGLYIHDVRGQLPAVVEPSNPASFKGKGPNSSGGIIVDALGETTPTAFHDLKIINNRIDDVDRGGIYFWSNWCRRDALDRWSDLCSATWFPHENVLVAGNDLTSIGGDGLVITGTVGAVVEHNTLDGFNRRAQSYNAGIWTANSDDVVMQYNTVTGGFGELDSQAFDIDHATKDVIVRNNFSHDNDGGFLLTCPDNWGTHDFRVYNNISVNDSARSIQHGCGGPIYGGQIFNNTFYLNNTSATVWQDSARSPEVEIFNNIFVAEGQGRLTFEKPADGLDIHDNLMSGFSAPADSRNTTTADAELFQPGGPDAADYRLAEGSAAIGVGGDQNTAKSDYFGHAFSEPANLGAYQGPALARTTQNGCTAVISPAKAVANGSTATLDVTVANPCTDVLAAADMDVAMSSDFTLDSSAHVEELAPGARTTVSLEISVPSDIAVGTYPVEVEFADARAEGQIAVESTWNEFDQQNFDDLDHADLADAWQLSNPDDAHIDDGGDSPALRLDRVAGQTNAAVWQFGEVGTPARISMRVKANQTNSALGIHLLDEQGNPVARVSVADLAVWAYTDGNSFINTSNGYDADSWYDLAITVAAGGTYSVTVDGEKIGGGATTGTGNPAAVRVQIPASAEVASSFLVDDVNVSAAAAEGDTHAPAPIPTKISPELEDARPEVVAAGNSVGIHARGLRPNEQVRIESAAGSAIAYADANGDLIAALPVPLDAEAGPLQVAITQDDQGDPLTLSASVEITGDAPAPACTLESEDFEATAIGSVPQGWDVEGDPAPAVEAEAGNQALTLSRTEGGSGLVAARCEVDAVAAPAVLTMKVRASSTDSALGIHWLDATGQPVARASLNELGTWSYTDGSTFVDTSTQYEAGQWYTVALTFDEDSYTLDVDGTQIGSGQLQSTSDGTMLRLQVPTSAEGVGTFAIDDISICADEGTDGDNSAGGDNGSDGDNSAGGDNADNSDDGASSAGSDGDQDASSAQADADANASGASDAAADGDGASSAADGSDAADAGSGDEAAADASAQTGADASDTHSGAVTDDPAESDRTGSAARASDGSQNVAAGEAGQSSNGLEGVGTSEGSEAGTEDALASTGVSPAGYILLAAGMGLAGVIINRRHRIQAGR